MAKKVLRTRLCDMLGTEYPIIQASMGSAAGPKLASAVSNAGGLGTIGITRVKHDDIREWIKLMPTLTDKPWACGILLPAQLDAFPVFDEIWAKIPEGHREYEKKLMQQMGFERHQGDYWMLTGDYVKQQVEIVAEMAPKHGSKFFVCGQGAPKWATDMLHQAGMKFLALTGTPEHATRSVKSGADVIMIHAHEGAGHCGPLGSFTAIGSIVDAVAPVPVVHGGGVVDGRGLAGALAMGCDGVLIGTRFLASPEAAVEFVGKYWENDWAIEQYKQRLVDHDARMAAITKHWTGKGTRIMLPKWLQEWEKNGPAPLTMPLQNVLIADIHASSQYSGDKEQVGGGAGQVIQRIHSLVPAAESLQKMVDEAHEILSKTLMERVKVS